MRAIYANNLFAQCGCNVTTRQYIYDHVFYLEDKDIWELNM